MAIKRKPLKTQRRKKLGACPFCAENLNPDYKDYKKLTSYLSDRAKIIGRSYTGVCSKHQRKLTTAIKRARHLGLLPFTPSL